MMVLVAVMMRCIIFCGRRGGWAGSITTKDPPKKDNVEGDDDDGGDDDGVSNECDDSNLISK